MNYYIQGNAANADKIKAAFKKLGLDVLDFGFADKTVVYCSIGGCGGCVQSLPYSINLMHILHSHPDYKELELPVEPKPHYDIANFKPFDKVLVRDRNDEPWRIAFYGYYDKGAHYSHFVDTCWSKQCIPFNEKTEHLLGITDMCPEEYINW